MLKELLRELFYPPYDFLQIMIILLIVSLVLSVIFFSAHSFYINRKIRRFFSAHKPTSGVVVTYDTADGDTYVATHSVVPGQLVPFVPFLYKDADQYIVVLECHVDDTHFRAEYEIPQSDYRGEKKGETVYIKDDWEPVGYEEIP